MLNELQISRKHCIIIEISTKSSNLLKPQNHYLSITISRMTTKFSLNKKAFENLEVNCLEPNGNCPPLKR